MDSIFEGQIALEATSAFFDTPYEDLPPLAKRLADHIGRDHNIDLVRTYELDTCTMATATLGCQKVVSLGLGDIYEKSDEMQPNKVWKLHDELLYYYNDTRCYEHVDHKWWDDEHSVFVEWYDDYQVLTLFAPYDVYQVLITDGKPDEDVNNYPGLPAMVEELVLRRLS